MEGERESLNPFMSNEDNQGVTINAAYAYFEEDEKGSIEKGKLADFVILDQNPLKVEPNKIKEIQVMETIKEGESIWQSK